MDYSITERQSSMGWENNLLTQKVLSALKTERMKRDLGLFSKLNRYSGSADGEEAADYITRQMSACGIPVTEYSYDCFRSLPLSSVIMAGDADAIVINGTPVVYSGVADRLRGELVFDELSLRPDLSRKENEERYSSFRGKFVLTYDFSFEFYYGTAHAGALGVIAIWPNAIHHHDTLGGVWGTPGGRDRDMYPFLPYVEVVEAEGLTLLAAIKDGHSEITLDVKMDTGVVKSSMPVATICGRSNKFVLLSGHYDSWYEGMTDNAAANVLMMETARALWENRELLDRSVVIAWWSGHSDARYSGSTWYCDNHWQELRRDCVAHINMDICGCMGSNAVRFDMTGMEGSDFNDEFLSQYNERKPLAYNPLNRSSDQTFWGCQIPVSIAPQFYVDDGLSTRPEGGHSVIDIPEAPVSFGVKAPFFWWHTKEDTIDKVSEDVLTRDCMIAAQLVCRYAYGPLILDMSGFAEEMKLYFNELSSRLGDDFDISPLLPLIDGLRARIRPFEDAAAESYDADAIYKRTAGELVRLKFTYSSPFDHDYAVDHPVYPSFTRALGLTKDNTGTVAYLAARTDFVRQRNRMVCRLRGVIDEMDRLIGGGAAL